MRGGRLLYIALVCGLVQLQSVALGDEPLPPLPPAVQTDPLPPTLLPDTPPPLAAPSAPEVQPSLPDAVRTDPLLLEPNAIPLTPLAEPGPDVPFGFHRADRRELAWLLSSGNGRFNMIDWESRADWDSLYNLADQRAAFDFDFKANLGFNVHWWSGPTLDADQPPGPDLPPRVYDLYADLGWQQRWCPWFATEVRLQPGLYTDFKVTPPDAFRTPGHALGIVHVSEEVQGVAGAVYLARNRLKWLPAAGFLWRPNPAVEARLVFPEPKVAIALNSSQMFWMYLRGEYGGGRWAYDTEDPGGRDWAEYSDLRLAWGLEWREYVAEKFLNLGVSRFLEVAYVFDRQLNFTNGTPNFSPPDGWRISLGRTW